MDVAELIKTHNLLKEYKYEVTPLDKGYTDKVLYINLSDNTVKEKDVPALISHKLESQLVTGQAI